MSRARLIKPGFYKNEQLAECSMLARFIFPGLWMLADRRGRLEDRPKRIKAEVLPYDDGDVDLLLEELAAQGLIRRYQADGVRLIQIVEFEKHQHCHIKEPESTLPAPDIASVQPDQAPDKNGASTVPAPDKNQSGPAEAEADTEAEAEAEKPRAPRAARKRATRTLIPPDFAVSERVRQWAQENGHSRIDEHLDAFKRKAQAKGYEYADWDAAFMEAIRENWARLTTRTSLSAVGQRTADNLQRFIDVEDAPNGTTGP